MKLHSQDAFSLQALGQAIREVRSDKNLSQSELARRTGLHPTYISRLERGSHNPTYVVILQLSKGLEVSAAELIQASEAVEGERHA
jgi:transcriptional regulator with XRE-family HTH domain